MGIKGSMLKEQPNSWVSSHRQDDGGRDTEEHACTHTLEHGLAHPYVSVPGGVCRDVRQEGLTNHLFYQRDGESKEQRGIAQRTNARRSRKIGGKGGLQEGASR